MKMYLFASKKHLQHTNGDVTWSILGQTLHQKSIKTIYRRGANRISNRQKIGRVDAIFLGTNFSNAECLKNNTAILKQSYNQKVENLW